MNTPAPPPGQPPDYISIPDHLKAKPIGGTGLPEGLGPLLRRAGIRSLGDLDGKRLSDFEGCDRWNGRTCWALRRLIVSTIHPGQSRDPSLRPIPMRYWLSWQSPIEVPRAAADVRLEDLPVSGRLQGVLEDLGV